MMTTSTSVEPERAVPTPARRASLMPLVMTTFWTLLCIVMATALALLLITAPA